VHCTRAEPVPPGIPCRLGYTAARAGRLHRPQHTPFRWAGSAAEHRTGLVVYEQNACMLQATLHVVCDVASHVACCVRCCMPRCVLCAMLHATLRVVLPVRTTA
jgi:hypothetical protein